jgi:hypothetical protein
VRIALSNPCFDFWLLLHHLDEAELAEQFTKCAPVGAILREVLGGYNKTGLNQTHYPLSSVAAACRRALRLDTNVPGGRIPAANTSGIYLLLSSVEGHRREGSAVTDSGGTTIPGAVKRTWA